MNVQTANKKDGFTIIEVVLVLAIAGLIFLIVFLAVPALQRNQRDTQRRSDMSRFMAQIQNYQSNTKGSVPVASTTGTGNINSFVTTYLTTGVGDAWADPSTSAAYTFTNTTPTALGTFRYATNATCGTDGRLTTPGGGGRKVAVETRLEGGAFYCLNN